MADAVVFLASDASRFVNGTGLARGRRGWSSMSTKPVVVYGASGYTGRLICEYLREFNVPFVAAGRNKDLLQEVVGKIPGIETAEHDIVEVEHTVEALTDLFTGAQVVCNTVGPFIKFGPEVVEACAAAGVALPGHHRRAGLGDGRPGPLRDDVRREGPAALARDRADVHDRRDRGEHRPGDAGPGHPRHPRALEGLPDLRLDADDLHHPQGGVVPPAGEPVREGRPALEVGRRRARAARARPRPSRGAAPATRCGSRTTRGWPTSRWPAG